MAQSQSAHLRWRARWVFPVDGPPLADATVAVEHDRIVAVQTQGCRTEAIDLGNVAILPGLVNAHTHLDLSGLRGKCPPTADFTEWLRAVIRHRRDRSPQQVREDIRIGLTESLAHGTTLVGDIASQGLSWPLLAESPMRAVVYRELLGLPEARAEAAWSELLAWLGDHPATATCRPGVSPHAPYSVNFAYIFKAATLGVPVAIHLAETAAELELLADRQGPFVTFLRELGVWDPAGLAGGADHVLRLLNGTAPVALAHGNYLPAQAPMPANGTIVYCPRTHAAFGHPPHPFRELLARGIRVALGTDSLASNPDLDVLAEARFLRRAYPDIPGATLLRMPTLSGAEALGWQDETGSLTVGKSADLVVLPLPSVESSDPHEFVLNSAAPVEAVMVRGRWVKT